ncbi:MAG: nuclear transport factor 2 family protein [Bacteroidota bacterium]
MKTIFILIGMLSFATAFSQSKSKKTGVENAIKMYAQLGDKQDAPGFTHLLHQNYRLVWYGGKDAPFIADKANFISQFEKKEWGGDERSVQIESIEIVDEINAVAKAILDGQKAQMRSLFTLIKVEGEWKVIGELVNATFK